MVPTNWRQIKVDGTIQGVFSVVCRSDALEGPHLCQSTDRQGAKIWLWGQLPAGELLGGVDLQVVDTKPIQLRVLPRLLSIRSLAVLVQILPR